jgi:GntR family transcriptional regulator, transcriptional repressor for pyruvate dehydrogenase complex
MVAMLKGFRRERLYDAVADELKRYIEESSLKAGDKLPPEPELCKQLNVGRTSLREALRLLQMMGLVEVKAGRGTYVRSDALESAVTRAMGPLLDQSTKLLDLAEVREPLELLAARLAAERRTEEHLQHMREQLERSREKVAQGQFRVEDDLEFHRLVFEAAGNQVLMQFVGSVGELMRTFRQGRLAGSQELQQLTVDEHVAIYEAIRDRHVRQAVSSMRTQVRDTAAAILAQIQQNKEATDPRRTKA